MKNALVAFISLSCFAAGAQIQKPIDRKPAPLTDFQKGVCAIQSTSSGDLYGFFLANHARLDSPFVSMYRRISDTAESVFRGGCTRVQNVEDVVNLLKLVKQVAYKGCREQSTYFYNDVYFQFRRDKKKNQLIKECRGISDLYFLSALSMAQNSQFASKTIPELLENLRNQGWIINSDGQVVSP